MRRIADVEPNFNGLERAEDRQGRPIIINITSENRK